MPVIAVDGPAASGKGTIARALASHFALPHMDTGLLYRAVALNLWRWGGDPGNEFEALRACDDIGVGPDDPELRSEPVSKIASMISAYPSVRAALLQRQQDFAAQEGGAVLDGRDIGTVIAPEAEVKLFVTASPEVRAGRRLKELEARGMRAHYDEVLADIHGRDDRDSNRQVAPLKPAPDAIILDTSKLDVAEAIAEAVRLVEQPDPDERLVPDQHEPAADGAAARPQRGGQVARAVLEPVRPLAGELGEDAAGVLDVAGGVEQPGADDGRGAALTVGPGEQGVQPAGEVELDVRGEEDRVAALLTRTPEAQVQDRRMPRLPVVAEQLEPELLDGRRERREQLAGGRSVVDDEHVHVRRRRPERHQAAQQRVGVRVAGHVGRDDAERTVGNGGHGASRAGARGRSAATGWPARACSCRPAAGCPAS